MCHIAHLTRREAARRLEQRKAFYERMDHRVGAGLDQFLGRVLATRNADNANASAVTGLDVARSVAA
jgi:hypothetical protein